MQHASTYEAKIFVGLREGYSEVLHPIEDVKEVCREYVNDVGLCVTVTPTGFIYTNGEEPGAIIGLINYPRFPSSAIEVESHAMNIAKELLYKLNQIRISIMTPKETWTISKGDFE